MSCPSPCKNTVPSPVFLCENGVSVEHVTHTAGSDKKFSKLRMPAIISWAQSLLWSLHNMINDHLVKTKHDSINNIYIHWWVQASLTVAIHLITVRTLCAANAAKGDFLLTISLWPHYYRQRFCNSTNWTPFERRLESTLYNQSIAYLALPRTHLTNSTLPNNINSIAPDTQNLKNQDIQSFLLFRHLLHSNRYFVYGQFLPLFRIENSFQCRSFL